MSLQRLAVLRNLKMRTKLLAGFALIAFFVAGMGIIGSHRVQRVSEAFHEIVNFNMKEIQSLLEIKNAAFEIETQTVGLELTDGKMFEEGVLAADKQNKLVEGVSTLERLVEGYRQSRSQVQRDAGAEKQAGPSIERIYEAKTMVIEAVMDFLRAKERGLSGARLSSQRVDLEAARDLLKLAINEAIQYELDELEQAKQTADETVTKTLLINLLMSVAAVGLAILIGLVLTHLIVKPVVGLRNAAQEISRGRLDARVDVMSRDEIGELGEGFNAMAAQVQQEMFERRRAEEEQRALADKLMHSNRELQAFAYIASHDLQEPLRKVTTFGDRLKVKCADQLDEQGKDYLERMQNAAKRMQTLINDLLNFSRVTTQAKPFTTVDLAAIAREVVSDLEIKIEQTKGRVEIGALPTIEADALQMRQLIQNLVGNALKFHKDDEPPVIKVGGAFLSAEEGGLGSGIYRMIVQDNGIGFEEKYVERVFGLFQRLHGRKEYEGTGIGLAICRRIVERHGGTITAKSVPSKGTTFIVTLPLKQAQSNGSGPGEPPPGVDHSDEHVPGKPAEPVFPAA